MKTILLACVLAASSSAQTVIDIDVAKPAPSKIPRTIYGTFLEPIGSSIYNGLWAETL